MLAGVLKDFDRLVLEDIPTPTPVSGLVLVRINSCGFCATDFKAINGIQRNVKEGDEVIIQPSAAREARAQREMSPKKFENRTAGLASVVLGKYYS
jgi:hypothetical protein